MQRRRARAHGLESAHAVHAPRATSEAACSGASASAPLCRGRLHRRRVTGGHAPVQARVQRDAPASKHRQRQNVERRAQRHRAARDKEEPRSQVRRPARAHLVRVRGTARKRERRVHATTRTSAGCVCASSRSPRPQRQQLPRASSRCTGLLLLSLTYCELNARRRCERRDPSQPQWQSSRRPRRALAARGAALPCVWGGGRQRAAAGLPARARWTRGDGAQLRVRV